MKGTMLVLSFIILNGLAFSQSSPTVIQKDVNEQVWTIFKSSYESRDWQTFNDVHTDDIMRVSKWGIKLGEMYKNSNMTSFQKSTDKRTIDFSFENRVYKGDVGYEVGFYRIQYFENESHNTTHYARFHVLLKKVAGRWKIAQDWDTSSISDVPITAENFKKANFLEIE